MSALAGAAVGLLGGVGAVTVLTRVPIWRRPHLVDRIAPYVRDQARPSTLLVRRPGTRTPLVTGLGQRLGRALGGQASVRRRLVALGSDLTVDDLRQEQVLWGAVGGAAGLALLLVRAVGGIGLPPLSLAALVVVGVLAGVIARDAALTRAVRRREEAIALELPVVAELLALAVGAGESPVAALERVTARSHGELARELRTALVDARAGTPFVAALQAVAERTTLPSLVRFVDGVTVALQRGTPLADVLRAQAADVREDGRRVLLETGGKREIAMMAPVVFLILPVVIVFALFPGAVTLTTIAH
ncbi:MAG TPA: type II secretion system F family protein [Mycobacteriales bacterium]